jgi:antitoxin ParD1/3/4
MCYMNVSLGAQWERFVNNKVKSGRYQTASEVLRDGLRLLEERERAFEAISVSGKNDLERKLETGLKQLDSGKKVPAALAIQRLRRRAAARRRSIVNG